MVKNIKNHRTISVCSPIIPTSMMAKICYIFFIHFTSSDGDVFLSIYSSVFTLFRFSPPFPHPPLPSCMHANLCRGIQAIQPLKTRCVSKRVSRKRRTPLADKTPPTGTRVR